MKKLTMVLAIMSLLVLAACQPSQVVVTQEGQQTNVITVSGMSEFEVEPDEVEIRVGIESKSQNAQEAQNMNRETSNKVMNALLGMGIRKDEIETYNYNVHRIQEWDRELERTVDRGYRVTNAFKITTDRLEDAGRIVDAAVQAGANNVEGINFMLSDDAHEEARTEALKLAASNARGKAQALASGLGVPLGNLVAVSETQFDVYPVARMAMAEDAMMAGGAMAPTPVSPQSVQVSARVSVKYGIGGLV